MHWSNEEIRAAARARPRPNVAFTDDTSLKARAASCLDIVGHRRWWTDRHSSRAQNQECAQSKLKLIASARARRGGAARLYIPRRSRPASRGWQSLSGGGIEASRLARFVMVTSGALNIF